MCRRCMFWKRRGLVVGHCWHESVMAETREDFGCAEWIAKVIRVELTK